jgi:hypothetical protein
MHVIYMSVNVGVQPLHCTDRHGHRPQERVDLPELQALRRLTNYLRAALCAYGPDLAFGLCQGFFRFPPSGGCW